MAQVTYSPSSPYYLTPQTSRYLGWWEMPVILPQETDQYITVNSKYTHRPDLLSNWLYDTPRLWWIFAMLNPDQIRDPIYDLVPDLELRVPIKSSVQSYL